MGTGKYTEHSMGKISLFSQNVRRSVAVICTAALVGTFVPLSGASVVNAASQTTIKASTTAVLNLRRGAGVSYGVIKTAAKNSDVTVVERVDDKWLKVKIPDGTVGYCSADYIDIVTDAKSTTYLNLRKEPGTNFTSIKTISPGVKLDILRFYGKSWMKVRVDSKTEGYVCTDYDYVSYLQDTTTQKVTASSEEKPQESNPDSNNVTISAKSKTVAIGGTFTLTAKTNSGGTFTWYSTNASVAAVTSKGLVTGIKQGKTSIVAVDSKSGKKVSCEVEVTKPKIKSITLSASSGTLFVGETKQLTVKVDPSNSSVSNKTSSSAVAKVSSGGLVTAVGQGSCTITAYDPSGSAKADYKLTVNKKSDVSVSLSASSASVKAGASYKLTAKVSGGATVNWSSSNTSVAAVRNGVVSALSSGTATIKAYTADGSASASCKITVTAVSRGSLSLSRYSSTVSAGKTLYIQGSAPGSVWWNVGDTSIASMNSSVTTNGKGFILAKNPGKTAVTYTDANGNRAICVLTVTEAEPIRFTYSSPNSAVKNSEVKLIAVTDKNRSAVSFTVNENGNKTNISATSKVSDGNTFVWTGVYKTKAAGTFTYSAYSKKNGSVAWQTCDDGAADIYVTDKTNKKTTSVEKLRASDEVINFIGEKEGFLPEVVPDRLANNIPTLAHGYVVWEGDKFYNGLTEKEGYALLVSAVNKENYARDVNNMLLQNGVKFNQQQFDALVSFSYNLGTSWTYSSDLKTILLNSYGSVVPSSSGTTTATVNVSDSLNLRESYTTSSKILDVLYPGEIVTLVSTQKYNSIWYKVKTSSGKIGYCSGTYLIINAGAGSGRDLNYVNKNSLINCMLAYHHAGGQCYYGLLYRRADELEMFLYGDYKADGRNNKYGFPSPYCLSF